MGRIFMKIMMVTLVVLLVGCGGSKKFMKENEASQTESGIINEYFDPLILDDDNLNIKKTISVESQSDKVEDFLGQPDAEKNQENEVSGFRVQICAVTDEEQARQIQREAILRFLDEEVILKYDSPYYKVRVGNCLTRFEAEKLQQLAIDKGFNDAWVVRTKVKTKPKAPAPPTDENLN